MKIINQLRRCSCGKMWQTHENGGKLFRCPKCGSTKKYHKIIKGDIYIHHKISPNEYSEILLKRTWHHFDDVKGYWIEKQITKQQ